MSEEDSQKQAKPATKSRLQMSDLARMAGVSKATVSRALSGSPLVNAETRDRIQALAREHRYAINLGAQNLRLQRNQTIAVVVPFEAQSHQHLSDPFFLAIIGALADALIDRGYEMLLGRVDADELESAARFVDTGRAMGLILIGQWHHHQRLNAMASSGLPMVVWGAAMPDQQYVSVGGDNHGGGRLAAEHLLVLGRQRIVFMGDPALPEVNQRWQGYRAALAGAGLAPTPELELHVPFEAVQAAAALQALLERGARFDAVQACSDVLALTAIQVLRAKGLRVPQDVAVVGYDDMTLAALSNPALTTVHQPVQQAGVLLVESLQGVLRDEPVRSQTMPVHLVARRSTGASE